MLKRAALFGIVLLITPLLLLMLAEDIILFHPERTLYPDDTTQALLETPYRSGAEVVRFPSVDGTKLSAWYISAQNRPTILYLHGNGGNIGDRVAVYQPFIEKGYGMLALDYRGYGNSDGTPTEAGLYEDAEAASRFLVETKKIPVEEQVILGASLGGPVAVRTAAGKPYRAVVLFSTFTQGSDVWRSLLDRFHLGVFSPLPWEWIIRQKFDAISHINRLQSPLIVAHREIDPTIPMPLGKALYESAKLPQKRWVLEKGEGHFVTSERLVAELDNLLGLK